MTPINFMIVDDSLILQNKLKRLLTGLGHRVIGTANTGAEAMTEFEKLNPDVVTMDITMPDMDGVEATRLITERYPHAVIIMVTSHGQEAMVMQAVEAGAKGYVLKPIDQVKLNQVIEQVTERHLA